VLRSACLFGLAQRRVLKSRHSQSIPRLFLFFCCLSLCLQEKSLSRFPESLLVHLECATAEALRSGVTARLNPTSYQSPNSAPLTHPPALHLC
jgi:hypothetical protein